MYLLRKSVVKKPDLHMNNKFLIVLLPILIIVIELIIVRFPIIQQSVIGYFYALFIGLLFIFGLTSPIFLIIRLIKKQKVELAVKYGLSILMVFSIFFLTRGTFELVFPLPLPYGSDTMTFNKELWTENTEEAKDLSPRQKMLQDVVNKLDGKSKQEVIALLGKPNDIGYFSENDQEFVYYLGGERNFISIDSEWLLVEFDKNGKFEKYFIHND